MRRFRIFTYLLLSLAFASPVLAAAPGQGDRPYRVVLIQSNTPRISSWGVALTDGLKEGLKRGGVEAEVCTEWLDADFWAFEAEKIIMRRICQRARVSGADLIVTCGDEAFYSLVHCGDSLPYKLPVVVSGVKHPRTDVFDRMPNVCGYSMASDFSKILNEAHRLFPERTEVICLLDESTLSRLEMNEMRKAWASFSARHKECEMREMNILSSSSNTVASAIRAVCYPERAMHKVVVVPRWSPLISFIGKSSKAPFFACQDWALTNGVLAVNDMMPRERTVLAGMRAAEVLKGEAPATWGVENLPPAFIYDYKQLKFFNIDPKQVEHRGTIINMPLRERYGWIFILAYSVVLVVLVMLIAWLVRANRRESRHRLHAQTRLLVQDKLVEQRDEFDNIVNSVTDGLITYDTDLRIHFVNNSLRRMLGLNATPEWERAYEGKMAGSIFEIYVNGENVSVRILREVVRTQSAVIIPDNAFMREKETGSYFMVSGEAVPIFAADKLTGMAFVCRNISEMEMQKKVFDMAIEESEIYPWRYDPKREVFSITEKLRERIWGGRKSDDITLEDVEALFHPDDLVQTREAFESIIRHDGESSERAKTVNLRVKDATGHYGWWEFRCSAVEGLNPGDPYMVLGVSQNIQSFKDAESALIEARDDALKADRLKSAFLANMSHEIRTPLNAIVGFSDLLTNLESFSPDEVKQFVETIHVNSRLLLELMTDILDLSRIESGTMEFRFADTDLNVLLLQVAEAQHLSMPPGVVLELELPEDHTLLSTDNGKLKQVVNNLVNNAKKFTTRGSITIGYVADDAEVVMFVEDTGCGMKAGQLAHIFERFYKADNFTQGAGLGLSICQTLVEKLKGRIIVASEPGRGTRFEVHFA